jgi:probable rRNA maturation factor
MKLNISVNNLVQAPVSADFLKKILTQTLKFSEFDYLQNRNIEISLALVSAQEIKRLNKIYRKKDAVTDILSFAEYENKNNLKQSKEKDVFLGELVLCYNDIKEYSQKEGLNLEQELAKVVSHGLLHLLGWQHSSKMFRCQEKVSNQITDHK